MNAVIMTVTSLLLNSVGVWFNLYISNKIGAEGMGVFQLMMSVYSMAVTLAASGINLAATRLVAEETVVGGMGAKPAMRRCLAYSLSFGLAAGAALFLCAPTVGGQWLGAAETVRPLRIMALSMPFLAMSCALNGYFTAVRRVAKCAAAQLLEQFLKITLTMAGLTLLLPPGLEYACLAITLAGVLAEAVSFLFEFTLYLLDSRRCSGDGRPAHGLTRRLLGIALPVAFSSYLRTGLSTVKNLLVPIRLQHGGLPEGASLSVFGTVHGVALPVILFPYAFLSAFNCLIVPELAQSHAQNRSVSSMLDHIFQITLLCSLGVCGILFGFSPEIGALVSKNPDVGVYIRLLAPVIPIMYLDTAVDNMLKGLDEQVSVMRYNVIDALFSLAAVWFLLPWLGIKGYILIICASEVFNFSLSLLRLIKVTHFRLDLSERVIRPLLCIAISTIAVHSLFRSGALPLAQGAFQTILMMVLTGGAYLLLLRLTRADGAKP